MNPLTNVKNLNKMNQRELDMGLAGSTNSWHHQYRDSAWIFVGGLPYDLSEGDVICVFSQYGEIVHINLVRDKKTGKSKGFCFICYQDQRSTILSVDNLNGAKVLNRTLRVDHVEEYKLPKEHGDEDDETLKLRKEGVAPKPPSSSSDEEEDIDVLRMKAEKKEKKKKKKEKKKKEKKKRRQETSDSDSSSSDRKPPKVEVKQERDDPAYYKYAATNKQASSWIEERPRVKQEFDEFEVKHSEKMRKQKETKHSRERNSDRRERNGHEFDMDRRYRDRKDVPESRVRGRDRSRSQERGLSMRDTDRGSYSRYRERSRSRSRDRSNRDSRRSRSRSKDRDYDKRDRHGHRRH